MRLVIVNPNITQAVTDLLVRESRAVASAGVEVVGLTAAAGVPAIDTAAEAEAAARTITGELTAAGDADAGIIGGFIDPGLAAARAQLPYPVLGIGEAAMVTACQLGSQFAVVTVGESTAGVIEALVASYALRGRCTAVKAVEGRLRDVIRDQSAFEDACVRAATETIEKNGADTVILGGAMFVGMARRLAPRIAAPVIDPMHAAVLQAESLVRLGAVKSEKAGG